MAFVKGKADEIAKSVNLRKKPFTVVCLRSSELIRSDTRFSQFLISTSNPVKDRKSENSIIQ